MAGADVEVSQSPLQYSLRTVFLCVSVVAGCAWLTSSLSKPSRHERAVAAIEEQGGTVKITGYCGNGSCSVSLANTGIDDDGLAGVIPHLHHLRYFNQLDLSHTRMTERGFSMVAHQFQSITLVVSDSQLTPAVLDSLEDESFFAEIRFADPQPSDRRIVEIARRLETRQVRYLNTSLESAQHFANRFAVGQCTKLGPKAIRALPALKELRARELADPAFVAKIDAAIAAVEDRKVPLEL